MAELIKSITEAHPNEIQFGERLRPIKRSGVESIRASHAELGIQKTAIDVRKKNDGSLWLIAGGHRLTLALEDRWNTIDVKVWRCTDDWAALMEIDDNLAGADLDPLDTAIFLAERKRIYERMHPETMHGAKGRAAISGNQTDTMSVWSFAATTAEKFGLSERHMRRLIAAGSALDQDDIARLRAAKKPVTLSDLQAISKAQPDQRIAICLALNEGTAKNAAAAMRNLRAQPGDAVIDPVDLALRKLNDAYARAPKAAKRQFVDAHRAELEALLRGPTQDDAEVVSFKRREA